ncbi:hypothetical protein F4810DRAFT_520454 [Camillea tinctor]|nr:hypothetical protein F4810DRAFT_520454 [Camillea tinctor]
MHTYIFNALNLPHCFYLCPQDGLDAVLEVLSRYTLTNGCPSADSLYPFFYLFACEKKRNEKRNGMGGWGPDIVINIYSVPPTYRYRKRVHKNQSISISTLSHYLPFMLIHLCATWYTSLCHLSSPPPFFFFFFFTIKTFRKSLMVLPQAGHYEAFFCPLLSFSSGGLSKSSYPVVSAVLGRGISAVRRRRGGLTKVGSREARVYIELDETTIWRINGGGTHRPITLSAADPLRTQEYYTLIDRAPSDILFSLHQLTTLQFTGRNFYHLPA